MAQVRRELHEDMQGVVAGAEAASDWHYYVRRYPWLALGVAVVAGYVIVPKRRRTIAETADAVAEQTVERVKAAAQDMKRGAEKAAKASAGPTESEKRERKTGLLGMAFGMIAPIALRAAQSYAANLVEGLIAQQTAGLGPMPPTGMPAGPGAGPARGAPGGPRPTGGPGRPPGPGAGGMPRSS